MDEKFLVATFDLHQVIYLPISKRCELFYRRKLSCYNFKVYNLGNGEGVCYFRHEATTSRGANEIARVCMICWWMLTRKVYVKLYFLVMAVEAKIRIPSFQPCLYISWTVLFPSSASLYAFIKPIMGKVKMMQYTVHLKEPSKELLMFFFYPHTVAYDNPACKKSSI